MKKNTIKAFTLVEMLIVIVIIGILIASLMPRMQSAQGRARDVARKNDLSQIQTAIITSAQDRGGYPGMSTNTWKDAKGSGSVTNANEWIDVSSIAENLMKAWMSSVPTDPNKSNTFKWIGSGNEWGLGEYRYVVAKRNWVANWWFALMAKTEVEGSSNRVVCNSGSVDADHGYILGTNDLKEITLCPTVTQDDNNCSAKNCTYSDIGELRYLLLY